MKNHKGITLIEILVVLAILSILVLSLYTAFKTGVDTWNKSKTRLEAYQNARVALDLMSRELASAVTVALQPSFRGYRPYRSGPRYGPPGWNFVPATILSFLTMGEDGIYEVTYHKSEIDIYNDRVRYTSYPDDTTEANTLQRTYERTHESHPTYDFNTVDVSHGNGGSDDIAYGIKAVNFMFWDEVSTKTWEIGADTEFQLYEHPREYWTNGGEHNGGACIGGGVSPLPRAVKIILTTSLENGEEGPTFETVVFLPYSETD